MAARFCFQASRTSYDGYHIAMPIITRLILKTLQVSSFDVVTKLFIPPEELQNLFQFL